MIKKLFVLSVSLLLLVIFSGTSVCQQQGGQPQQSPQQTQAEMNKSMQQMTPAMNEMMKQMMDSMLSYMAKKETAVKIASFTRNYYVALVKTGFSKEEALQIVINSKIPTFGN